MQTETPLFHEIASVLYSCSKDDLAIINTVESLADRHGDSVFDEFFYVLTRKRLGKSAANHWKMIVPHVDSVINPGFRHQGFLPSVFHYMQYEADVFSAPRFIESDYIDKILHSSVTDGLTGLYNQTYFKTSLTKHLQISQRTRQIFSIIILDLDRFKEFNDNAGHLSGDHALQRTASIIASSLRESDSASRYGGEEFAIMLPNTSKSMARKVAERIRKSVEKEIFAGQEFLSSKNLTISGGIAEFPFDADNCDDLIKSADGELYKSKMMRNCIFPNDEDRRKSVRRPIRSLVEFISDNEDTFKPCLSFDISEFGLCLGCDQLLPLDSSIKIRLSHPYWHCSKVLDCKVRQSRRINEICVIGLEFDQLLELSGIDRLSGLDRHNVKAYSTVH